MQPEDVELRAIINAMARLLGETVAHVAYTGAFDGSDRDHIIELVEKLDRALRAAQIRGADHHLAEAAAMIRNADGEPRAPQSRQP